MEILGFTVPTITLIAIAGAIAVIAFFVGKNIGSYWEKAERIEAEKTYNKNLAIEESKKKELQRELESLKQGNQRYTYFLIRIPEMVKNLNSNLSFDETVSSIIRIIKDLIDVETVELYIFNQGANSLELVAACGSNKKKRLV